jgi:hypothetical protein
MFYSLLHVVLMMGGRRGECIFNMETVKRLQQQSIQAGPEIHVQIRSMGMHMDTTTRQYSW